MRNIPVRQKPIGNLPTTQATELEIQMSEPQDQVIQEQGAEPQTQQPAVKFPVLGSASAKLTFNYRQPSKSALEAAAKAGEPAPIKRESVTIELNTLADTDIINMARRALADPNDAEATAVLKWLAVLAKEDAQTAIKNEFDQQPAHSNIDLTQVNMDNLTLMALATAPRTNRAVPLTEEDWANFTATLAAFYKDELPKATGPQFDNMVRLLRTWRALANLDPDKRKNALNKVLTVLSNFTVWVELALKEGKQIKIGDDTAQIDGEVCQTIIAGCVNKAQKLLDIDIPDVDLGF